MSNNKWWTSTVVLVIGLILMWGISWSVIKIGLGYTPPVLFAGLRTFLGGILLIIVAAARPASPQLRKHWRVYAISALFNAVLFFGLQTIAGAYLPSGLLAVLVYLQPILVGIIAWATLGEPLGGKKLIGLIFGFIGVTSVCVGSFNGHISVFGVVLAIVGGVVWAIGTVYSKTVQTRVPMIWLVALQFTFGGVVLLLLGSFMESWTAIHWTGAFIASLAYLTVIGVSLSWLVWFTLVHRGQVSRVSSYVFFVPILSVLIGSVVLHEAFTPYLLGGLVFVTAGIYLVNAKPFKTKRPALTDAVVASASGTGSSTDISN